MNAWTVLWSSLGLVLFMFFPVHCMGRWEHMFMHVACVCECTSVSVGSLSHLEMLWDIIFWNSFHQPSHFSEYSNIFNIFNRWECKNVVRWNQVVDVPGLVSPPPFFVCPFSPCLLSRIKLLNVLCEKEHFHDAELTCPGRETWWLTTKEVKFLCMPYKHVGEWRSSVSHS